MALQQTFVQLTGPCLEMASKAKELLASKLDLIALCFGCWVAMGCGTNFENSKLAMGMVRIMKVSEQ